MTTTRPTNWELTYTRCAKAASEAADHLHRSVWGRPDLISLSALEEGFDRLHVALTHEEWENATWAGDRGRWTVRMHEAHVALLVRLFRRAARTAPEQVKEWLTTAAGRMDGAIFDPSVVDLIASLEAGHRSLYLG